MKHYLTVCIIALSMVGCKSGHEEIDKVKSLENQLDLLQKRYDNLKARTSGQLAHLVFLELKESLDEDQVSDFFEEIQKIRGIEFLTKFEVGQIADTGDARFISDHDIIFQVNTSNMEDMIKYQKHPVHLKLKEVAPTYLASAPKVFDYWVMD